MKPQRKSVTEAGTCIGDIVVHESEVGVQSISEEIIKLMPKEVKTGMKHPILKQHFLECARHHATCLVCTVFVLQMCKLRVGGPIFFEKFSITIIVIIMLSFYGALISTEWQKS